MAQSNADTPELVTREVPVNECPVLRISPRTSLPCGRSLHPHTQDTPAAGWASASLGACQEAARALRALLPSSGSIVPSGSQARVFQQCRDENTPRHCRGCPCPQSLLARLHGVSFPFPDAHHRAPRLQGAAPRPSSIAR